jgi:hypothetical protein
VGRSFYIPEDVARGEAGDQAISSRKYFKATFAFSAPEAFQDRLLPGTKGQVIIR